MTKEKQTFGRLQAIEWVLIGAFAIAAICGTLILLGVAR